MANKKFCIECGFKLPVTAKFCEKCGMKLSNDQRQFHKYEKLYSDFSEEKITGIRGFIFRPVFLLEIIIGALLLGFCIGFYNGFSGNDLQIRGRLYLLLTIPFWYLARLILKYFFGSKLYNLKQDNKAKDWVWTNSEEKTKEDEQVKTKEDEQVKVKDRVAKPKPEHIRKLDEAIQELKKYSKD